MLRPIENRKSKIENGFTLIELLVVIAIIAVLMGLLLPAIQKVREAANRMMCANHLKQLGIAAHNYHGAHDRFPNGWRGYDSSHGLEQINQPLSTWHVDLLPYIEQGNMDKQIVKFMNPNSSWGTSFSNQQWNRRRYYWFNRYAFMEPVALYACPSDALPRPPVHTVMENWYQRPDSEPPDPNFESGGGTPRLIWSLSSYKGNGGTLNVNRAQNYDLAGATDGIFYFSYTGEDSVSMATDIPDGLSGTILFGERYAVDREYDKRETPLRFHNAWCQPDVPHQVLTAFVPINFQYESPTGTPEGDDRAEFAGELADYQGVDPPSGAINDEMRKSAYGSGHPGGANFAFCDGSVKFLAEETPLPLLQVFSTRSANDFPNKEWE